MSSTLTAAMQPFTKRLVELLPNQFHSKAVQVDGFLRVKGAPAGTVYALGDASTVSAQCREEDGRSRQIHSDMLAHLLELWEAHDLDKDDQL
jgi:NADH dehydrogenase